jgi:hypothetical protein
MLAIHLPYSPNRDNAGSRGAGSDRLPCGSLDIERHAVGIDALDLYLSVERRFGVRIVNEDLLSIWRSQANDCTAGQLHDVVCKKCLECGVKNDPELESAAQARVERISLAREMPAYTERTSPTASARPAVSPHPRPCGHRSNSRQPAERLLSGWWPIINLDRRIDTC